METRRDRTDVHLMPGTTNLSQWKIISRKWNRILAPLRFINGNIGMDNWTDKNVNFRHRYQGNEIMLELMLVQDFISQIVKIFAHCRLFLTFRFLGAIILCHRFKKLPDKILDRYMLKCIEQKKIFVSYNIACLIKSLHINNKNLILILFTSFLSILILIFKPLALRTPNAPYI